MFLIRELKDPPTFPQSTFIGIYHILGVFNVRGCWGSLLGGEEHKSEAVGCLSRLYGQSFGQRL